MRLYEKSISNPLVGIYLRLSREDGDKAESDSIGNQRSLIKDYLAQHSGMKLVDEYVDDGYSGTNFDRPNFQRMVEDIKKKKINIVIAKDLSRLGRNYIETGRYLERIFPMLGVRFIAVTDHYDSADSTNESDQIIIPFKNLINDAYCRDISIKIRSQLDVKRKSGKFIGNYAGYGYFKDKKDKNHLVIDEYAANIVRLVFRLKLDGYSAQHIAMHLNGMQVLTPSEYKRHCGVNYNSGFRAGNTPGWSAVSVTRILKNELYTGDMVQGKKRRINYKVKKTVSVPQDEWVRVESTHEAIIPKEVFYEVQELMRRDTRTAPTRESVYLLSGYLRCGDCGQNMVRRCTTKNGKKYVYFHCSTYKCGEGCTSHLVSEEKVIASLLGSIQYQIALIDDASKVIRKIEGLPNEQFGVKGIEEQLKALHAETERYKGLKVKVYEDYLEGIVTKEEFKDMKDRFTEKLAAISVSQAELEKKRAHLLTGKIEMQPWMEAFKQYQNIKTLDRKTLSALIEYVEVFSKDKIVIHFRYEDEINDLVESINAQNIRNWHREVQGA